MCVCVCVCDTLQITEKAPLTALADERMRMQVLCLSLIIFSQVSETRGQMCDHV